MAACVREPLRKKASPVRRHSRAKAGVINQRKMAGPVTNPVSQCLVERQKPVGEEKGVEFVGQRRKIKERRERRTRRGETKSRSVVKVGQRSNEEKGNGKKEAMRWMDGMVWWWRMLRVAAMERIPRV